MSSTVCHEGQCAPYTMMSGLVYCTICEQGELGCEQCKKNCDDHKTNYFHPCHSGKCKPSTPQFIGQSISCIRCVMEVHTCDGCTESMEIINDERRKKLRDEGWTYDLIAGKWIQNKQEDVDSVIRTFYKTLQDNARSQYASSIAAGLSQKDATYSGISEAKSIASAYIIAGAIEFSCIPDNYFTSDYYEMIETVAQDALATVSDSAVATAFAASSDIKNVANLHPNKCACPFCKSTAGE